MASVFVGLLSLFIVLDLIWWRIADRRVRVLRNARLWRLVLGTFMSCMLGYLAASKFCIWFLSRSQGPVPLLGHMIVYIWHFLFLPTSMLLLLFGATGRGIVHGIKWLFSFGKTVEPAVTAVPVLDRQPGGMKTGHPERSEGSASVGQTGKMLRYAQHDAELRLADPEQMRGDSNARILRPAPTRRQMLAAAAIAVPPMAAAATAIGTLRTMYGRRLRHFDLRLPQLPPELDGMTIAHVSDTHIGKFLHRDRLPAIADDVNKLEADFVVFTGDLIDLTLADLPFGVKFLQSLKGRCGKAICEGNHDLMEEPEVFEDQIREVGLPLIVSGESTMMYTSRAGRSFPVQFLGVPWSMTDAERPQAVQDLQPLVRDDAFRILLAHHPHTFDAAASAGYPLVLAGHTHGGQMMLNERHGMGSLRFRYISGLYRRQNSSLIVNNGLGNWFPLRINAPAEIVHLTLRTV